MANLVGVYDGGEVAEAVNGSPEWRGLLIFRASVNEAHPIDFFFSYPLSLQETIFKHFSCIRKYTPPIDTSQHRPAVDREEFIRALEGRHGD